ncbi:MAG: hypothetical protein MJ210_05725 [Alphaproteobacteria bacterium]|nr:hypothetical protein [Alphaproteobacteria bacterium]
MDITIECQTSYEEMIRKGFYNVPNESNPTFGDEIALITCECSEALQEYRNGHKFNEIYYNGSKPEGIPIELADVVLRVFTVCGRHGIDLEKAIKIKREYNRHRPYKHGGKLL